jgi:hypothetical protein
MHGSNLKIKIISVSSYFIFDGQFIQPPTALARQVENGEIHKFVI